MPPESTAVDLSIVSFAAPVCSQVVQTLYSRGAVAAPNAEIHSK
jgi:hypothetical protein